MTETVLTAEVVAKPIRNGAVVDYIRPTINHIITEDDEPVDNLPSEKKQRLLVEPLYTSTRLPRPLRRPRPRLSPPS